MTELHPEIARKIPQLRILLVEDSPDDQEIAVDLLYTSGAVPLQNITVASTYNEAKSSL